MRSRARVFTLVLTVAVAMLLALSAARAEEGAASEPEASQIAQLTRLRPQLEPVTETVSLALGLGNVFLVQTSEGHVIIDTGVAQQAAAQRDLLLERHPGKVSHVIVTHGHGDHDGGVPLYQDAGAQFVAQRRFVENQSYARDLAPIMAKRNAVFWAGFGPTPASGAGDRPSPPPGPVPDVVVDDALTLEIGGRRFELLHVPSESTDMLAIWLPDERIAFSGDLYGSSFPNLYTLRGHYYRFAWDYLHSLDRLIALGPEILAPSHFRPIVGRAKVKQALVNLREAVRHVHDETVAGMNAGKDLWTLMQEIDLPPELGIDQSHGSVEWSVRAIWEGYLGWFRYDSTTEIYSVPPSSVHDDLAELAGGAEKLVERAREHFEGGRSLETLHLVDISLNAEPNHRQALALRLEVLRVLLSQAGENFSRQGWLRHRIAVTEAALEGARQER